MTITDRPASSEAPSDDALRAVVDATADGIVVVDDHGVIRYANPAARELLGRTADELVGQHFGYPLDADVTEIGISRAGQPMTVEMRVTSLTWDGRPTHLAALRDVSERIHAQEELRSAVQLRNDVISIVAHDLRTPLSVIHSAARLLLDADQGIELDAEHRDVLEQIRRQAWHVNRLVESLLTLSRLEGGQLLVDPRSVDVERAARQAVDDLAEAGVGVDVAVSVSAGTRVTADEDHLRQILVNYLTNAVKYGRPPIAVEARHAGDHVEIVVSDEGDGVPDGFVPKLFQRFRRAERVSSDVEGTGLGLSVTRCLAEAAGGEVGYAPNEPTGARFSVRLPAAAGGDGGPPADHASGR